MAARTGHVQQHCGAGDEGIAIGGFTGGCDEVREWDAGRNGTESLPVMRVGACGGFGGTESLSVVSCRWGFGRLQGSFDCAQDDTR